MCLEIASRHRRNWTLSMLDLAVRKMEFRQLVMHHLNSLIPQEIHKTTDVHPIP
jgi:hypothetical protein